MKLAHALLARPIRIGEEEIPVLVVEDIPTFRRLIRELTDQAAGEEGRFVLSVKGEPLECRDHLHAVTDFFTLEPGGRRLQAGFQTLVSHVMARELGEETVRLEEELRHYLGELMLELDYPVSIAGGERLPALIKALKLQPVLDGEGELERLTQYIDLCHGLLRDQLFVLVGAGNFFGQEELEQLCRMALGKKWNLLLLENRQRAPVISEVRYRILDEDLCEIGVDLEGVRE